MTTGQYMRRLIAWRRAAFFTNAVVWGMFHLTPLSYGLLVKAIFDSLSHRAPAGWNAWTFLALLAGAYGSRQAIFFCGFRLFSRYYLSVQAFFRRNLLDYLMCARGSRVIPESPAEAVSRFRDDVNDLADYAETLIDLSGLALYGAAAIAVLLWVNSLIAAIVCAPLLITALMMRSLSGTIRTYRRRMREATARVVDAIGETFAAVQAVKVAGQEESMTRHLRDLGVERRRR